MVQAAIAENGHTPGVDEINALAEAAEELLSVPTLDEIMGAVSSEYREEVVAGQYLELAQVATRAKFNAAANRTLNPTAAREWQEQQDIALRAIGLILREYPQIKTTVTSISAALAQDTRKTRAERLAQH